MADPTVVYQLLKFRSRDLTTLTLVHQGVDGRTVQLGYPTAKTVIMRQFHLTSDSYHVRIGYPPARRLSPKILNKDFIFYNFKFFYPSNGKVPGSPIPRAGQVSPRPL
jgi:hypothetical protein